MFDHLKTSEVPKRTKALLLALTTALGPTAAPAFASLKPAAKQTRMPPLQLPASIRSLSSRRMFLRPRHRQPITQMLNVSKIRTNGTLFLDPKTAKSEQQRILKKIARLARGATFFECEEAGKFED